jgi:RNA recognition motif-containing protein
MHQLCSSFACREAWQPAHARSDGLFLLCAVYVGNLAWATSTDDLRQLFSSYGQVEVRVRPAEANEVLTPA